MTVNDINSKVNFQDYCAEMKQLPGYQFIKMPRFGWYAFNKNQSDVVNFVDLIYRMAARDPLEVTRLTKQFIKDLRHLHEIPIIYSETMLDRLLKNMLSYKFMYYLQLAAAEEIQTSSIHLKSGKYEPVVKVLEEKQMSGLLDAGVGFLSESLLKQHTSLPERFKGKLVIPSYNTPKHICSLEVCSLHQLEPNTHIERETYYQQGERGWYGKLEEQVVGGLEELGLKPGFTWDKKADLWLTVPVDINKSVSIPSCIKLWTEAKNAQFNKSPLDLIQESGKIEDVKTCLKQLNQAQLIELEKKLNIPLVKEWKQAKYREVKIGSIKFIQQDNQYLIESRSGELSEYTNFIIVQENVYKKKSEFVRSGYIACQDHVVPFEWKSSVFYELNSFKKQLHDFFFENKIGIPIILNSYQSSILEVISKFNDGRISFENPNDKKEDTELKK